MQSPNIGHATLSQNALGIHDDTISNGFSSEVTWIFCNRRNKTLKQLSLPTNSSSVVYRCFVKQLHESIPTTFVTRTLLFTDFWRAAIVWCSQTTFDQRAILQKCDNSRATSHKMVYKKQIDKIEKGR